MNRKAITACKYILFFYLARSHKQLGKNRQTHKLQDSYKFSVAKLNVVFYFILTKRIVCIGLLKATFLRSTTQLRKSISECLVKTIQRLFQLADMSGICRMETWRGRMYTSSVKSPQRNTCGHPFGGWASSKQQQQTKEYRQLPFWLQEQKVSAKSTPFCCAFPSMTSQALNLSIAPSA